MENNLKEKVIEKVKDFKIASLSPELKYSILLTKEEWEYLLKFLSN